MLRDEAAGEDRYADPRSRRGNDAVDPLHRAGHPVGHAGGLECFDADRPADARSLVDHQGDRGVGLEPGAVDRDPDEILPTYELAAALTGRVLEERHVEVPGLDPAVQLRALRDREREPDPRIQLLELAEDLRQGGQGEVVRHPHTQPAGQSRPGEVTRCLVVGGEDRPGEPGHRLAVGRQRDHPGVPDEQRPPDCLLQLADVDADRRLSYAERGGCPGEAQRLADREKAAQLLWVVHGPRPYNGCV